MFNFLQTKPISSSQKAMIENAIKTAEKETSGEVKVIIEKKNRLDNAKQRAEQLFEEQKLYATEARNGVLFYVSVTSRELYILGDKGINQTLGDNYWGTLVNKALSTIKENHSWAEGLCEAITALGTSLKKHYPYQSDDANEIGDEVDII